jgi:hypothetical protein
MQKLQMSPESRNTAYSFIREERTFRQDKVAQFGGIDNDASNCLVGDL